MTVEGKIIVENKYMCCILSNTNRLQGVFKKSHASKRRTNLYRQKSGSAVLEGKVFSILSSPFSSSLRAKEATVGVKERLNPPQEKKKKMWFPFTESHTTEAKVNVIFGIRMMR